MVAKVAACCGMITNAIPTPVANIRARIVHRLLDASRVLMAARHAATHTSPPVINRRGPSRPLSRPTICVDTSTPTASGNVVSPDSRGLAPEPPGGRSA